MEAIADAISGATTTTGERVLEEYGDPATEPDDNEGETETDPTSESETSSTGEYSTATDGGAASETADASETKRSTFESPRTAEQDTDQESDPILDLTELTEKQRETLRAIAEHPDATQAELADRLGVSSPIISQRVSS